MLASTECTILSCLAHVINLAMQALIGAYSNSPHFDLKHPDAHVPLSRDEVGLVRAIAVKVRQPVLYFAHALILCHWQERSSGKRKEMFRAIQVREKVPVPTQLILDMKIRWSSTYFMLHRAEGKREVMFHYFSIFRLSFTFTAC